MMACSAHASVISRLLSLNVFTALESGAPNVRATTFCELFCRW